jgi:arginase family enzyme
MGDVAHNQFDTIPSFLGVPVGDLEDLVPGQVAMAGYFCDNLDRPAAGQRYLARQLRYASRPENAPANVIDLGDVNVFPLEADKHFAAVISQCEAVLETGARMILVGGDSSGLKALGIAVRKITNVDVPVVSVTEGITGNLSKIQPIILSVDLQELAGIWMSQPRHLTGLSPAQMIAQIDATPGNVVAAAIFGLAPALDNRGATETCAALAILQAVAEHLEKGAS